MKNNISLTGTIVWPYKKKKEELITTFKRNNEETESQILKFALEQENVKSLSILCKTFNKKIIDALKEGMLVQITKSHLIRSSWQNKSTLFWTEETVLVVDHINVLSLESQGVESEGISFDKLEEKTEEFFSTSELNEIAREVTEVQVVKVEEPDDGTGWIDEI